jgi:hypothetical protein
MPAIKKLARIARPRERQLLLLAVVSWTVAASVFWLHRSAGPAQQRINVQWVDDVSEVDRQTAEAALNLLDGEELEPDKWVYRPANHSRDAIRRIVSHPMIADTAHINRESFRILIDAPQIPAPIRRLLATDLGPPFALLAAAVGLVAGWFVRRELSAIVSRLATGPADAPRAPPAVGPPTVGVLANSLMAAPLAVQNEWDWWASRAYFPILCMLLAFVTFFTAWHGRTLALEWDGWTIGDWLITYSGGFVRRGLGGELLLLTSRGLGEPANIVTWVVFVLVFAIFGVAFAVLVRARRMTFWFLVLCLSPAFLLFTPFNPDTVGRKDALLLASLAVWTLTNERPLKTAATAAFAVLAFLLTLTHELLFFFTPYLLLTSYLQADQRHGDERWWTAALVPIGSTVGMVLLTAFTGSLGHPALCERMVAAGAPRSVCEGVLSYGHESTADAIRDFAGAATGRAALSVVIAVLLTLAPPVLFVMISSETLRAASRSIGAVVAAVVFSMPLFVLAVDWGRWLAIHAALLTITCVTLLPRRGLIPSRPSFTRVSLVSLAAGALVLVLMSGWSLRHCCRANLVTTFVPFQFVSEWWHELES